MLTIINVFLILLSIPVLVIPIEGKLIDNASKKPFKLTNKGINFYVCVIVLTLIAIFKEYLISQGEIARETKETEFRSEVKSVTNKISTKLQYLDTIEPQIDKIHAYTLATLNERYLNLKKLDKLNQKIEQIINDESNKIAQNKGELTFLGSPHFEKINSEKQEYYLKIALTNIGNRTISKFKDSTILLIFTNDTLHTLIKKIYLEQITTPLSSIPSQNKIGRGVIWSYIFDFDGKTLDNIKYNLYLKTTIKYLDILTNKTDSLVGYFSWRNFEMNKNQFIGSPKRDITLINRNL